MTSIHNSGQPTFQIGELAKRTALGIDAIRFYERRKLLPTPSRTGRFRLYTAHDVERLRFLRKLQSLGFSLEEIRELIGVRADGAHACSAIRDFLKANLSHVAEKIGELQELETELEADLRKCNSVSKQKRWKTWACLVLEGEDRSK